MTEVLRHKTAIRRVEFSRPVKLAVEHALVNPDTTVFDYGCGLGDDLRLLAQRGIVARGWDPVHRPDGLRTASDVVNLGFVVNVIEDASERADTLRAAWSLARKILVVSARTVDEVEEGASQAYQDGVLTRLGTFQKYFGHDELRSWIQENLGTAGIAAGPGIFFVFRDDDARESFLASRFRRRVAAPRLRWSDRIFEEHRERFDSLIAFLTNRGRLPERDELPAADELAGVLGSVRRAFQVLQKVSGVEGWERIREERTSDLLVYLALGRFDGRRPFHLLPPDLQLDIRDFCRNYKDACARADDLLFSTGKMELVAEACRSAPVGKQMPNSLYVHVSAVGTLPPLLRVYEGCARAYIGLVEGTSVVKLHRLHPQVSYLVYPGFDRTAHPSLAGSVIVDLKALRTKVLDYSARCNPPILHRKEELVAADFPGREKFSRLTRQEERLGLLGDQSTIGTIEGWEERLAEHGLLVHGHRIVRRRGLERQKS